MKPLSPVPVKTFCSVQLETPENNQNHFIFFIFFCLVTQHDRESVRASTDSCEEWRLLWGELELAWVQRVVLSRLSAVGWGRPALATFY